MKHLFYLTALTALWVAVMVAATEKGPYWDHLEDIDLYIRAAKYEVCRPVSRELESTVRACVDVPDPVECNRIPVEREKTKQCLDELE